MRVNAKLQPADQQQHPQAHLLSYASAGWRRGRGARTGIDRHELADGAGTVRHRCSGLQATNGFLYTARDQRVFFAYSMVALRSLVTCIS